jgi:hypothetical protein
MNKSIGSPDKRIDNRGWRHRSVAPEDVGRHREPTWRLKTGWVATTKVKTGWVATTE